MSTGVNSGEHATGIGMSSTAGRCAVAIARCSTDSVMVRRSVRMGPCTNGTDRRRASPSQDVRRSFSSGFVTSNKMPCRDG